MDRLLSYILFGAIAILVLSGLLILLRIAVTLAVYVFIIALIVSAISYLYDRFIKNKR